jgi:hypothetical protein
MLKPWLFPNTSGKAPKKRYRIPRRMADRMQRLKHYITTVSPLNKASLSAETHHRLEEKKLKRADA